MSSHRGAASRAQGARLGLRHWGGLGSHLRPGQCHQSPQGQVPGESCRMQWGAGPPRRTLGGGRRPAGGPRPGPLLRLSPLTWKEASCRCEGSRMISDPSRLSHSWMWILEGSWPEVTATSEALAEPAQKCEALWTLPRCPCLRGGPWSGVGAPSSLPLRPVPLPSASCLSRKGT